MVDVLTNWVAALRPNLIGVATLRQAAGEAIEFRCGGRIFIFIVVEGRYRVKDDASMDHLDTGDIYFVQREEGKHAGVPAATVSAVTDTAVVICASFAGSLAPLQPLLATAPSAWKISGKEIGQDTDLVSVSALIENELRLAQCGRDQIGNHLFEALFLLIVRHCSHRAVNGFRLLSQRNDPYVTKVIDRMQQAPAHGWTVDELASLAGLSRAAFARRFKAETGDSPLRYLMRCRMHLAADMLRRAATVRSTAEHVGYLSEFAFSRAFSSYHGVSPRSFRARSLEDRPITGVAYGAYS